MANDKTTVMPAKSQGSARTAAALLGLGLVAVMAVTTSKPLSFLTGSSKVHQRWESVTEFSDSLVAGSVSEGTKAGTQQGLDLISDGNDATAWVCRSGSGGSENIKNCFIDIDLKGWYVVRGVRVKTGSLTDLEVEGNAVHSITTYPYAKRQTETTYAFLTLSEMDFHHDANTKGAWHTSENQLNIKVDKIRLKGMVANGKQPSLAELEIDVGHGGSNYQNDPAEDVPADLTN